MRCPIDGRAGQALLAERSAAGGEARAASAAGRGACSSGGPGGKHKQGSGGETRLVVQVLGLRPCALTGMIPSLACAMGRTGFWRHGLSRSGDGRPTLTANGAIPLGQCRSLDLAQIIRL